tara:strand:- start:792 stop:1688 length:897 start_codon:yes stop_codon:yes gene_type:complete
MALPALGAIVGGLGKGLLGLGKGLAKGMSAGNVAKTAGTIVGRKTTNKISAPRQDTSQTISPSYYEEPKEQSVFKRTASDGSIESVKITVTNIKSVLFKQQKQLAKQSKQNEDLEGRFSDLEKKKSKADILGKGVMSVGPISDFMNGVSTAFPLVLAALLGNALFGLSDKKDKKSWYNLSEEDKEIKGDQTNFLGRKRDKMGRVERFFAGFLDAVQLDINDHDKRGRMWGARNEEGQRIGPTRWIQGFGDAITGNRWNWDGREKVLKNSDQSSLNNGNDGEGETNVIIVNRPIEVPVK